jgi:hypothetical protein
MFEFAVEKNNTIENEIQEEINNQKITSIENICEEDEGDLNIDDI